MQQEPEPGLLGGLRIRTWQLPAVSSSPFAFLLEMQLVPTQVFRMGADRASVPTLLPSCCWDPGCFPVASALGELEFDYFWPVSVSLHFLPLLFTYSVDHIGPYRGDHQLDLCM